jgi:hypothetical protein
VEDFKIGKKRDAVNGLMSAISRSLAAVTLSAPDYDTLMVCLRKILSQHFACQLMSFSLFRLLGAFTSLA